MCCALFVEWLLGVAVHAQFLKYNRNDTYRIIKKISNGTTERGISVEVEIEDDPSPLLFEA